MAVKFQHGNIADVMQLAQLASESEKEERAIARAHATQQQIRSIQASKEMAEFNVKAQLEKQKEAVKIDAAAENRAREWELEKMTINSQLDFARETRKREQKEDEYEATIKYLEERDDLSPEQKRAYGFKAFMKKQGVTVSESQLLVEQRTPTVSNRIAAMRELQKDVYKEPGLAKRLTPKFLGGRKGLPPNVQKHKEFLEGIVGQGQPSELDAADQTMNVEPASLKEFEDTVMELAKIDKAKADAYFRKYTHKFD